ncbi:MAG: hypothetical protein J5965_11670, partial [Aeriscardovia sp.]|nr:hypothetical protein [Aeriscardovia sp.]
LFICNCFKLLLIKNTHLLLLNGASDSEMQLSLGCTLLQSHMTSSLTPLGASMIVNVFAVSLCSREKQKL